MDHDYLKAFLHASIELLSACDFLDQFLNDDPILVVRVTRCDLNVKVATEDNTLHDRA